jgi:formylglycine-generating enzyme required for sulfatase activity
MLAIRGLREGLASLVGVTIMLALASGVRSEVQDEAVPTSAAAVAARAKRDAAAEKAQAALVVAKAAADKQYSDDLSKALNLAMKAGNLDEAKRIDVQRSRIDAPKPEGDGGEAQPPKSPAATAAKGKHDTALNKADAAFRAARILADKQYRAELAAPLRVAMKAADLEEAKRIDAARKAIDSEMADLERGIASGHSNVANVGVVASYAGSNKLGMKFIRIEAGEFMMGSPETEVGRQNDETLHHVKITKPFMMAMTTVTQAQWKAVMGNNPSSHLGDDFPVDTVSWNDAVAFCEKLSAKEGKHYRLPTEAEWEYACRAGTQTTYGGTNNLDEMGWYAENSAFHGTRQSHPVAQKKPNAWGLYDMHGNIWQWTADGYALAYAFRFFPPPKPFS